MSRCFPFPPPGYEKKPRPEEDLLKEEKRREKEHKKEKKDKDKREGKDKKERDKSGSKHKEKKDKKEKHRDKKEKNRDKKKVKEKDKSKDKEKSSISEDASFAEQPATRSIEKVHTKKDGPDAESHGYDEKRSAFLFQGKNGQNPIGNRLFRESEESKFVQELGRRIRDEGKAVGSQTIDGSSGADCRGNQEIPRFSVRGFQNLAEDEERNRDRRVVNRQMESQRLKDGPRFSGITMVQNPPGPIGLKVEEMPGPVQKDGERMVEGKEKSKERGDDKRGKGKVKEKKEKKSHGKDKGREKEKKKEERIKETTEHKKNGLERSKELYRSELSCFNNNSNSQLSAYDNKSVSTEENLKKRKGVEINGFPDENEVRFSKLPRLTSYQLPENGRILEACRTPSLLASDKPGIPPQNKVEKKQHLLNGTIDTPPLNVPKQKLPSTSTRSDQILEALNKSAQADQVVEASRTFPKAYQGVVGSKKHNQAGQIAEPSRKPSHPDLKYLAQVLSVPQMEQWSEVDDQEWLFSGKNPPKKLDVSTSGDDRQSRAWSEALHIESADIYALPYVIPY